MGTHPIFESDFDCLTAMGVRTEILVWTDFNQDVVEKLRTSDNDDEKRYLLADCLHLDASSGDPKCSILLDAFQGALGFAMRNNLSPEAISVLLAVLNRVHNFACQTSFENTASSATFMEELIKSHSLLWPPFAIEVFTPQVAKLALEYIRDTYFRHFKLYKYVFTPRIAMDISFQDPNEENVEETPLQIATNSEESIDDEPEHTLSESEIEQIILKQVKTEFDEVLKTFEKQITEVAKQAKEKLSGVDKGKK